MARPIKDPTADAISGLSKVIEAASSQQKPSSELAKAITQTTEGLAAKTVRLYGIGSNPKALSSDLAAIQKMASKLEKDNHISFADVATDIARYVPAPAANLYFGNGQSDKWELGLDQAVASGILDQIKLNPLDSYKDPSPPVSHPHPAYGNRRLSTSARAANAAESMPWNQSGNVDRSAVFTGRAEGDIPDLNNPPRFTPQTQTGGGRRPPTDDIEDFTEEEIAHLESVGERAREAAEEARQAVDDISAGGGGRIPPAPPGGNGPPGPPDEPDDDNDGILRQLLEFFQRMFGVRPEIANRNFLDTLANNLTSILGGVPAQAGADGQRPSSVATLMDTFADYFNVPRETEEATREAQDNLRRSIDRLTEATNGVANGGTASQPQTRWQRFRGFFRRGRTRRGGIATATRLANFMRPVLRGVANVVPSRWRQAAGQAGANIMGRVAPFLNISPATAARFGAAMPVAGMAIGVITKAVPLVGTAIAFTVKAFSKAVESLNNFSKSVLSATFGLAEYNGIIASSKAFLDYNREMRKFDLADKNKFAAADHIAQRNRLENAMQPWEIMGANASSFGGTVIDSALSTVLEHINKLIATGMEIHAFLLERLVWGDQGEAQMREAAAKLRNPAANMPNMNADIEAVFGQNAAGMIDAARRMNGPRRPNNGGN